MGRISCQTLTKAINTVQAMDFSTQQQLADEIYRTQPNMLASVIVLSRFGVSMEKMNVALNILLVCFTAMKISGLNWPVITEDDQERQLQRLTAQVQFSSDLSADVFSRSVGQYAEDHAEKALFAYVSMEAKEWLQHIVPEESDKYVLLCICTLVNCIASVDIK